MNITKRAVTASASLYEPPENRIFRVIFESVSRMLNLFYVDRGGAGRGTGSRSSVMILCFGYLSDRLLFLIDLSQNGRHTFVIAVMFL